MENFLRDLGYSLRTLRKRPAFAAIIVLIFAFGTGANLAIFSLVHTILIRPLPYTQPDRLVRLWEIDRSSPNDFQMTSVSNLRDWRQRNRTFEGIAAWKRPDSTTLTGQVPAEEIRAAVVTSNFFAILKTTPFLGRTFLPEEENSRHAVAVVSYGFWESHLKSRRDVAERVMELDQESFQIVGVLPKEFKSPAGAVDVYIPMVLQANQIDRGQNYLQVFARMKQGITQDQAQADLQSVASALEKEYPSSNLKRGIALISMQTQITSPIRTPLMILFGTVILVLLIACSNISNLMIVRGFDRKREFTVRLALGATRARLIKQMLTENLLLFFAGGAAGILVGKWMLKVLLLLEPGIIPDLYRLDYETESFVLTLVLSLLTGFIFGLAPAFQLHKKELTVALRGGERGSTVQAFTGIIRNLFLIAQLALSLTLLISAALLVQSFVTIRQTPSGFNGDQVLIVQQSLDGTKYLEPQNKSAYYKNLIARLKERNGIRNAAAATVIPLGPFGIDFQIPYSTEESTQIETARLPRAYFRAVTTEYFKTLQITLRQGRYFSENDSAASPLVVILNQTLAGKIWPGENAVGKSLRFFWADWQTYKVVGVTGNTLSYGTASGTVPELYVPDSQIPYSVMNVVIRFDHISADSADQVRKAFVTIDPLQPAQDITSMKSLIDQSMRRERFVAALVGAFAILALLLASAGTYGTFSFLVTRRTREIGIRMALGATRFQVRNWILKKGIALTVAGLLSGMICAVGASAWLKKFLFGIQPVDPMTFTASAFILLLTALLACLLPAHRASSIDPNTALHHE